MGRARTRASAPKTNIQRVAGYLRVSTDEQRESGLGLGDQRMRVQGMAAAKGWPEATLYVDDGVSGTKPAAERPELARLLADVRAGQVDAVIVLDLSRLARRTLLVLDLVDELRRRDVAFVSCKEQLDTASPQGQFVLTMFAALAQLERDLIAERTTAALAELGRTTGDRGGRIPYGYLRTEERVRVDPAAAGFVRRIFSARRRGESLRDIATKLNAAGVVSPLGGAWRHTTVAGILANRAIYAGGKRADSELRWPAILGKREETAA